MESRMEKYQTENQTIGRTQKNKKLYEEINNLDLEYVNVDINNAIELNNREEIRTRSEYQRRKEFESFMPKRRQEPIVREIAEKEDRVYDINEILKLAKENKLFESENEKKKLLNTEYNILTKLDIDKLSSKKEYSKENLKELIDDIYKTEKNNKENKEIDLDLFEDLKEKDIEKVEISEDLSIKLLEKPTKEKTEVLSLDEDKTKTEEEINEIIKEVTEEQPNLLEKTERKDEEDDDDFLVEDKKTTVIAIIIIVVVLSILGAIGYLLYKHFVG